MRLCSSWLARGMFLPDGLRACFLAHFYRPEVLLQLPFGPKKTFKKTAGAGQVTQRWHS